MPIIHTIFKKFNVNNLAIGVLIMFGVFGILNYSFANFTIGQTPTDYNSNTQVQILSSMPFIVDRIDVKIEYTNGDQQTCGITELYILDSDENVVATSTNTYTTSCSTGGGVKNATGVYYFDEINLEEIDDFFIKIATLSYTCPLGGVHEYSLVDSPYKYIAFYVPNYSSISITEPIADSSTNDDFLNFAGLYKYGGSAGTPLYFTVHYATSTAGLLVDGYDEIVSQTMVKSFYGPYIWQLPNDNHLVSNTTYYAIAYLDDYTGNISQSATTTFSTGYIAVPNSIKDTNLLASSTIEILTDGFDDKIGLQNLAPFSYFYSLSGTLREAVATTTASFPELTLNFGDLMGSLTVFSTTTLSGMLGADNITLFRNLMGYALWILFAYAVYGKIRNIFR